VEYLIEHLGADVNIKDNVSIILGDNLCILQSLFMLVIGGCVPNIGFGV